MCTDFGDKLDHYRDYLVWFPTYFIICYRLYQQSNNYLIILLFIITALGFVHFQCQEKFVKDVKGVDKNNSCYSHMLNMENVNICSDIKLLTFTKYFGNGMLVLAVLALGYIST